jgi:hypothetical protein
MSLVDDPRPRRARRDLPVALEGLVATTAAAEDEPVEVLVVSYDGAKQRFGPYRWMPRPTRPIWPRRDDECVIVSPPVGDPFIAAWWPAGTTPRQPSIASAGTITIPPGVTSATITGTATITSIDPGDPGQEVTLIFAAAATVTDGSNLKLAGHMVATADDTLTLLSNGTSWFEKGRSVN